jgi:hypothetical protein
MVARSGGESRPIFASACCYDDGDDLRSMFFDYDDGERATCGLVVVA